MEIKTIDKAIDRFTWRFQNLQNGKFAPNQTDLEALKFIADWVNAQQEETINEHQMFAKLYVRQLNQYLWNGGNLKMALGQVEFILQLPLSYYVDVFALELNILKYRMYCEENNIEWQISDDLSEEDKKEVYEHIISDKKYMKNILGHWPKEKLETSLINELSEVIQKYKNLP